MPRTSSIPCSVPSSPGRPCNTLRAASGLSARSVAATSRSADHPPMRTATCFMISAFQPNPFDLPLQIDAGMGLHPLPHSFAQRLDVGCAGTAKIDKEIAVELGHLRTTDGEPATAGFVHQLPGAMARRIFKGRAPGPIARLARLALFLDVGHFDG